MVKWHAHTSSICKDISLFLGCTKNLNMCNGDGGATVIAFHILQIVKTLIRGLLYEPSNLGLDYLKNVYGFSTDCYQVVG